MSATPGFAATPRTGVGVCTTANTDKTGATTAQIKDILTGVAAGTKIEEVVIAADGNPADCTVTIFLHDGTSYKFYDDIDIGDPAASSTTIAGYRFSKRYDSLYLPTSSWKIAASITVTTTAGNVNVWAHGADF